MLDQRSPDTSDFRIEHDSMGSIPVPTEARYGAQTERARQNFPISGERLPRTFIRALGLVKAAAARANRFTGALNGDMAEAVERAAMAVAAGEYDGDFVVDVYQSGSGTSTNMNANEIIARLASQSSFQPVHPNDHVNRSQSSNDVIPSAIHLAAALQTRDALLPALSLLRHTLSEKSEAFGDVQKAGRTHLQDAVPLTLGQEFGGYARQVEQAARRIETALEGLYELPLGGTAVGTGLNAPEQFAENAIRHLSEWTGLPVREAENHFEAQSARDAACFFSGALRACAVSISKIANDIRWMGSGPHAGLGELKLAPLQPGSSIMPGKVNPVIAESTLMVCAQVIGLDATVTWAAASGNFELNTMMPLIAYDLLQAISLLSAAAENFALRCIKTLEANRDRCAAYAAQSLGEATEMAARIGYDRAAELAHHAYNGGEAIAQLEHQSEEDRKVDDASKESFPASDPPATY